MNPTPANPQPAPPALAVIDPRQATREVMSNLLDLIFWVSVTLGTVATSTSVLRILSHGMNPNVVVDIATYLLAVMILILRKKIPVETAGAVLFLIIGLSAIGNLLTQGLASVGLLMLMAACAVTGVFFGIRVALVSLGAGVVLAGGTGTLICLGLVQVSRNADAYYQTPLAWISHLSGLALYVTVIVVVFGNIQKRLYRSMDELNRQSRQLRESEQKYRLLADNMTDMLFTQDMQFNVVYVSPSITAMAGYTPDEFIKLKPEQYLTPESLIRVMASFKEFSALAQKGPLELPLMEYEYIRKNGTTFWGELRNAFISDDQGNLIGIQGICRDVSERKKAQKENNELQERLRHAEKMEAIGQLAGGIAHDLNNHLTGIFGAADCLRFSAPRESETMQLADTILAAGQRAADLVRKLLTFARKGATQRVPVDVPGVVEEVASILRRSIDPRIAIATSFETGRAMVRGDPTQLESSLLNLGINARDALSGGGRIEFSVRLRDIDKDETMRGGTVLRPGRYVEMTVADNGTGMDPGVQERLFTPFFTTKGPGKGTGLGLAAVYGTVAGIGGGIVVESEKGRGTTFRILLPAMADADIPETAKPAPASALRSVHVLVVDDEPSVRAVARMMLTVLGHRVTECADGPEAIAVYEKHDGAFDVAFIDLTMPNMKGTDLFTELRRRNPALPVIFTSGRPLDADTRWAMDAGARAFVAKPYSIESLKDALTTAFA